MESKLPKKILLIEMSPFPFHVGGGYAHLCLLSKGLIEEGHEVHILSAKPSKDYKMLDYPAEVILHNVGMRHKMFGKGNRFFAYLHRMFFELSFVLSAKKKIKEIKPDIINTQSLITTALPCTLLKKPFVATQHGVFMKGFKELWDKRGRQDVSFIGKIYDKLEKYNSKYCKEVIGVNQTVVDYYSKYTKSSLIGNSIDIKPYDKIRVVRKEDRYLFLGRISEEKGLDYLLDALRIVDKELNRDIEFIIAGSGNEAYIDSLKSKSNNFTHITVNYAGPVYGEAKLKLYKSANIFVLPSMFESFGIVLLEAMAAGCGIIASNCSGPKEIVKPEFGLLVDYTNEEERVNNLAAALIQSLSWDEGIGLAAREEVEKYDYKIAIQKYIKVYERLEASK